MASLSPLEYSAPRKYDQRCAIIGNSQVPSLPGLPIRKTWVSLGA